MTRSQVFIDIANFRKELNKPCKPLLGSFTYSLGLFDLKIIKTTMATSTTNPNVMQTTVVLENRAARVSNY